MMHTLEPVYQQRRHLGVAQKDASVNFWVYLADSAV